MKALLKDPLILALILGIGVVYLAISFHYLSRNSQLAAKLEKVLIATFIIVIIGETGATMFPLPKFHPRLLALTITTPPTIVAQITTYIIFILLLSSRLRHTLKDLIQVFFTVLVREPFLFILLLLITLSAFWSDTPWITFRGSLVILETALIAFYTAKQYSWQELYDLLRWLSLVVLILSLYYALLVPSKGVLDIGWGGIVGHKNHFSFFMAFTAVIWMIHAFYYPQQRRFSLVIILLALFALNQGNSGASKVIAVGLVGLWFYLGFVKRLKPQWAFVSVIIFLIVSIILTVLLTENVEFIVVDTLNKDLTLTGRTDFWPLIIDKINERPLLGYGISGFWQPWRGLDNPAADIIVTKTGFAPPHSHNGFLDLATEIGWLGLSVMILSFFTNIAKAVIYLGKAKMPAAGIPILLLTYTLMTNVTESGIVGVTSVFFWYVVVAIRTSIDLDKNAFKSTEKSQELAQLQSKFY
ncbi:O-antigen ligase family protein [Oscillatoria salina]|uniref:O-antigen ligase family protein n=1 Tax=Oscillatoria salina TaxID=331517 RepID=UPI001CCC1929|nr:O-antigen ligase family protein [Oscillatoria salina]MBZ8180251.1 O-antigen ligase family protein [Oscillatoria salina IIICB1]